MGRLEEYVEAVTRRLRPDAELHMDVAQELRDHLEDAAEEARERGLGEDEALDAALKAFGDREQMADALWEANRRRMRLRAVIKWTLRATLVPAALALSVYVCGTYFVQLLRVNMVYRSLLDRSFDFLPGMELPELQPRSDLTPDERFVFDNLREGSSEQDIARVGALMARYPENPSFYAQYVKLLSVRDLARERRTGEDELHRWLPILDRGEEVEPDNAYYNYLKAALLMGDSSTIEQGKDICFTYTDQNGQEKEDCGHSLTISDPAVFEKGIEEVYKGIRKPYCNTRASDAVELKLSLGKAPSTLTEDLTNFGISASTLMPRLSLMPDMSRRLPAYAFLLASEGDQEGATRLLEVLERPATQMGADAQTLIELLVAQACVRMTLGQAPAIYEKLGMPEKAAEARSRFETANGLVNSLYANESSEQAAFRDAQKHYGVIYLSLAPAIPGMDYSVLGRPYALLEHAVVEEIALGLLLAVLMLAALILGAVTYRNLWKSRARADGPKLFFVGWRRLGWIVLLSLVVPVGLYLAYTRLMPSSSMAYGIHYACGRLALELSVLLALISIALMATSYKAVRQRCREAGMDVPAEGYFNPFRSAGAVLGAALLAAAAIVGLVLTKTGSLSRNALLSLVAGGILLGTIVYLGHQLWLLPRGYRSIWSSLGGLLRAEGAIASTIFALCAGVFSVVWARGPGEAAVMVTITAGASVALFYAFLGGRRQPEGQPAAPHRHFHMTFLRSLVPILTVCLLVLGLSGHAYLRDAEAAQARKLNEPGPLLRWEVEMMGFKRYQDHLRELNQEWLDAHQASAQRPH